MDEQSYDSKTIKIIDAREWVYLRLFKDFQPDIAYVIIGYLQEYRGGYVLDDQNVDVFFVSEPGKAVLLQKICEKYLAANQLENDVECITAETGHSFVTSAHICNMLKRFYTVKCDSFSFHPCHRLSEKDPLFQSPGPGNITSGNPKQLSFLMGVFLRNRKEKNPTLYLAGAIHKLEITVQFLRSFCVTGDHFSVDYQFHLPPTASIHYDENGPFMEGLWKEIHTFIRE